MESIHFMSYRPHVKSLFWQRISDDCEVFVDGITETDMCSYAHIYNIPNSVLTFFPEKNTNSEAIKCVSPTHWILHWICV